ncbi:restriction endonuclease [Peribacillus frigoritolerans]|uniref:restriction endonuclease n=1 Tax=Peribacillus frigoritolerans TaxID=450367 RepID=UPI0023DCD231|nr:restriction endonuclease [Peribacillus frigoritolerans]MDF1999479.1 restriction endonuclease [Peribacillus frigoritolerans]
MKKGYMSQIALSKRVGWSEGNGRRWIKIFKEYIPVLIDGRNKLYNEESYKVLSIIKALSENNFNSSQILEIFSENGIPSTDRELEEVIESKSKFNEFDQTIVDSIPSSKDLIIPLLNVMRDKKPYTSSMLNERIAQYFLLSEAQLSIAYPDSKEFIFTHRMRASRYSLKKQDYIEEVSKYTYQITEHGLALLNDNSEEINEEIEELEKVIDPFEVIQEKVEEIEDELITKLVDELKKAHWRRLETIVVELLTAMGYGDGQVTEKTNDGGLDGVIKEDKLGLDNIYVQAKRWENTVGRPEVMSFSGALDAKGARKGIFITTSNFTKGAEEYVERLESKKIILIGGKKLARLMIENNIGISIKKRFVVKEVDFSYFEGE